eukprot:TRINITY_DN7857_c0_g1_i5.p1 TRINITY_DN7857_c0_g1~~TRINITY_DN7857_c0_g1_i5.p1  ORF type:complete len:702 (+),score=86.43 TRINITY_DN7857_c0_g1_i5:129-2234(+)
MIQYDYGEYHCGFIWQFEGSTIPLAAVFAVPTGLQAVMWRFILERFPGYLPFFNSFANSAVWTASYVVLGLLLGFRTNKAYARFWEGMTLVQQMRAEWFESCSNLFAFSAIPLNAQPCNEEVVNRVTEFHYTLIRLMSLMHGAALRQIGGNCEEFDVLDVHGLDTLSMEYLNDFCSVHSINRVEVLLHWIQVLITDNIANGVLVVPPPILTRAYQTLSRGMVNLHDVRKLADIPFPFPLSQMIVVMLLVVSMVVPAYVAASITSFIGAFVVSFIPLFGMWSITFIAGQLEQPFGLDPNDLPLANQQFEMNNSLLMLLDESTRKAPRLNPEANRTVELLRMNFGDPDSRTDSFASVFNPGQGRRASVMKRTHLHRASRIQQQVESMKARVIFNTRLPEVVEDERQIRRNCKRRSNDSSERLGERMTLQTLNFEKQEDDKRLSFVSDPSSSRYSRRSSTDSQATSALSKEREEDLPVMDELRANAMASRVGAESPTRASSTWNRGQWPAEECGARPAEDCICLPPGGAHVDEGRLHSCSKGVQECPLELEHTGVSTEGVGKESSELEAEASAYHLPPLDGAPRMPLISTKVVGIGFKSNSTSINAAQDAGARELHAAPFSSRSPCRAHTPGMVALGELAQPSRHGGQPRLDLDAPERLPAVKQTSPRPAIPQILFLEPSHQENDHLKDKADDTGVVCRNQWNI